MITCPFAELEAGKTYDYMMPHWVESVPVTILGTTAGPRKGEKQVKFQAGCRPTNVENIPKVATFEEHR